MFPPFCNLCFCWQSLRVPTYIRLCVLFCLFVTENPETSTTLCGTVQIFASAVPPTRSGFPDFGPDPDFFDQTGPDLVRNLVRSPDFSKNCQTNAWNWLLLAPFERVSQCQFHGESPGESGFFYWVRILDANGPDFWKNWSGFSLDFYFISLVS